MLENNIMTHIIMAIPPWGNTFYSFFFFFFRLHFFLLYRETPPPLHFLWRYIIDKSNNHYFMWNNSISTKLQKEETTYNLNPYINLSWS